MTNVVKLKRGTGSDPSASDMVVGEPVIRTDTAELFFKKDDGTVAKVSGGGGGPDFKYLALRNAANNGSASYPAADFTLVTDGTTTAISPAAAATLLVSYAGVIQQPSTGTSTPANGFALSGSTIKFSANIAAAPDFIIYQESGGIGEPSDNTVTSAKIVDGAIVNADVNASAAIAGTKISPDFGSQNIVTTGNLDIGDLPNTTNNSLMKIAIQDTDGVLKSDDVIKINPNQGVLKVNELYLSNNHVRAGSNGPLHLTTANANGTVDLKINTTHVEVNGNLLPATDSTDNVGASGTRWANVYSDAVNVAGDITVTGTVDGVDIAARNTLFGGLTSSSGVLSNGVTATTQSASDNSTKVATTAYTDTAISNLVDSSPGALNTLNELAAALGDDANFSTTVTNSIATKMPLAGGSFVGDVLFDNQSNAGKDIFWDESADYLNFKDNVHATFGDGSDLRIYHDGSHNILLGVNGADFKIKDASNNSAIFDTSAGVELFYANSKKFETTSTGVTVTGKLTTTDDILCGDNVVARFGTGQDLTIYHNGTSNYIQSPNSHAQYIDSNLIIFRNGDGSEQLAQWQANAESSLFYDNVKKLETTSTGITVTGDIRPTGHIYLGDSDVLALGASEDLTIHHDGTSVGYIDNNTGLLKILSDNQISLADKDNGEDYAKFIENGACELYYDNSKKLQTESNGVRINGILKTSITSGQALSYGDNAQIHLGTGDDLQLYHDGSNSYISEAGTGSLYIKSSAQLYLQSYGGENFLKADANGAVELYYDNEKVFETYQHGVLVQNTNGNGEITIRGSEGNGAQLYLQCDDADDHEDRWRVDTNATNGSLGIQNFGDGSWEKNIECNHGDNVELYYDNSLKLETSANGIKVYDKIGVNITPTTALQFLDHSGSYDGKASWGNSADLQIYHTGSHAYINNDTGYLHLQSSTFEVKASNGETEILASTNAHVQLNYDGAKKLETQSGGIKVNNGAGGSVYLNMAASGGSSGYLYGGSNQIGLLSEDQEWHVKCVKNAGVELLYDNTAKLETRSGDVLIKDDLRIQDNNKINIGTGDDLQLFHDGNSHIENSNSHLYIKNKTSGYGLIFGTSNTNRFQIGDTGHITPSADNSYDIGQSNLRIRNIYTGDLHLSNEGGDGNTVDGTTGNWTIQEGAENLFIVNNKNGKKFKIALQEVS